MLKRAMFVRLMASEDVNGVLGIQEPASVRALAAVFPQDAHPFPVQSLRARWLDEIADPTISCWVGVEQAALVGFFAISGSELLHFGAAVECWGTGVSQSIHEAVIERFRGAGVEEARLWVFEQNPRARRFYERLGWTLADDRRRSSFPPHPVLLEYRRCSG